jgi:hypothetical protein
MATQEGWRPVAGYEGLYEVSDAGRVRSCARLVPTANRFGPFMRSYPAKLKALYHDKDGYVAVSLGREGVQRAYRVSRLVLTAFDRAPEVGEEACHRNHNKNDNTASNLAWGTRAENEAQKDAAGRRPPTTVSAKLPPETHEEVRRRKAAGENYQQIAAAFDCHWTSVWNLLKGKTWRSAQGV